MNFPELQFAAAVRKLAGHLQRAAAPAGQENEWSQLHPYTEFVPEALAQIKATVEQIKAIHRDDVDLRAPF